MLFKSYIVRDIFYNRTILLHVILTKEIMAANRRILTRRSSNCSRTSCQMDFPISKINKIYIIDNFARCDKR